MPMSPKRPKKSNPKTPRPPKEPLTAAQSIARGYPKRLGGSSFGGAVPAKRVGKR